MSTFPTIALVDGHHPSFKVITGLAFDINIVTHALGMLPEQAELRQRQAERMVSAWNSYDMLVAENQQLNRAQAAPVNMILHCPACGMQHIDAPERDPHDIEQGLLWANPPHRSHLCHGCGHIWRPADVPTNGVAAITTTGKADSPTTVGACHLAQIEYRYTGGTHWCPLGSAERMKADFDGVYRLKAGEFPTWRGDGPAASGAVDLPEWDRARAAVACEPGAGEATPIDVFLYNNEPAATDDEAEFRYQLQAALNYAAAQRPAAREPLQLGGTQLAARLIATVGARESFEEVTVNVGIIKAAINALTGAK